MVSYEQGTPVALRSRLTPVSYQHGTPVELQMNLVLTYTESCTVLNLKTTASQKYEVVPRTARI